MILDGDALTVLRTLPDASAQCCVTSPPYFGLRDYGADGQIGLEDSPEAYVEALVIVFQQVRRVLRTDGTLWLNLGDSYVHSGRGGIGEASTIEGGQTPQNESRKALRASFRRDRASVGEVAHRRVEGLPPKNLLGMPWRVAFALQEDGWILRADIVWHKRNPMPESVRDRPTKAHEYVFLFSKSPTYFYDAEAIAEPTTWPGQARHGTDGYVAQAPGQPVQAGITKRRRSGNKTRNIADGSQGDRPADHLGRGVPWEDVKGTRNARSVWTITSQPYPEAHFATFPEELPRRCILAGSRPGDAVLDPFAGSGTTCAVADAHQRDFIGIELNPEYADMARRRVMRDGAPLFTAVK